MKNSVALTLLLSLTLSACVDENTTLSIDSNNGNEVDSILEIGTGSEVIIDSVVDTGSEVIIDSVVDTGSEAIIDSVVDTGSEVIIDSVVGTDPEVIIDSVVDTGSEVIIDSVVGTDPEVIIDSVVDTGSEVIIDSVVDTGSDDEIVNVSKSLDQWIETFEFTLSGKPNNGSLTKVVMFPAARPNGGLTIGWNELDQGHLMRIGPDMKAEGVEWDLDGLMIVKTLGLPDDGVAVLAIDWTTGMTDSFNVDRHLRLFIYDAEGNKTRETSIVGGTGLGLKASWFSWSGSRTVDMKLKGERIAIFTKISRYWVEESGTHQGDLYIEVDADGKLDQSTYDVWSASHSNRQHLVLGPNDEGLRLIVGDAHPFGLEYQTKEQFGDVVVWPNEEQQAIGKELAKSSVSAGDLCGFQYRDGRLFATVASGRTQPFSPSNDYADVLLLSWALGINEGDEVNETWLTETAGISEKCPTLTAIGEENQLIVWGTREGTTATLALLDGQGELISGPTASTESYHGSSIAIAMPNGSVAWTYAERYETKFKVSIVKQPIVKQP